MCRIPVLYHCILTKCNAHCEVTQIWYAFNVYFYAVTKMIHMKMCDTAKA